MNTARYRAIRPQIRSGDLIAFEANTQVGRLIRTWTGSRYVHVGIAMWLCAKGATPRLFVLESRRNGVGMRLLSGAGDCWYIPTGIQWTNDVNRFVWPSLGNAKYDWRSVCRRLALLPAKRDKHYFCSEFAGEILMRGGFPLSEQALADPGELVHSVLRNGRGQIYWVTAVKRSAPKTRMLKEKGSS